MALINCPECNKLISDKAISCPDCGYPMSVNNKVNTNNKKIIFVTFVGMIILAVAVVITIILLKNSNENTNENIKSAIDSLQGDDLIVYKMMLEVCKSATNPSKVNVLSGTVTETVGVFRVSYDDKQYYNVLVAYENGKYNAENLDDRLAVDYKDLLYETGDFSVSNVNKALREKWK